MDEPIFRGATPEETDKMRQYFGTLPAYVQETIYQSGAKMASVEELQKCSENMTKTS